MLSGSFDNDLSSIHSFQNDATLQPERKKRTHRLSIWKDISNIYLMPILIELFFCFRIKGCCYCVVEYEKKATKFSLHVYFVLGFYLADTHASTCSNLS